MLNIFSCSTTESSSENNSLTLIEEFSLNIPEPSGLSFQTSENILWAVSDHTGKIYKLKPNGTISQIIDIEGNDLEGIAFDETDNTLWVVEEENRKLIHLTTAGNLLEEIQLSVPGSSAHGLEGICLDDNHHIWVLNEKEPGILIELSSDFFIENEYELDFAIDYSGIYFDKSSRNFWIVSDESGKIFKWNPQNGKTQEFNLSVQKAEGVVFSDQDSLFYVVSDSEEKLYVFRLAK